MFNNIAHRYDFLNHFLSLGIDFHWRKRLINRITLQKPETILDVATGTGDLAIAAAKLNPNQITGVDIADDMLAIGRKKISEKKLDNLITLVTGDSENLQFADSGFDVTMAAFGVRNFENLEKGLSEMYRVLKKEGKIYILEFSKPTMFPVKQLYFFYFKFILPFLGRLISGDKSAYSYLPASVSEFPDGEKFVQVMQQVGFRETSVQTLTLGIVSIYEGKKI